MNSTDNFTCPTAFIWYMFPYNVSMFVLYILVIFGALTANILVFIAVCINPRLRQNVASYFIISLAVSDIAATCFSMPFDLESFATFGRWHHNEMLCIVWTTSYLITIPTSMWNLFVLSIDRYRTLSNPWDRFKQTPFMTKKRAILALGTLWICSIVYALIPQMGWNYTESSLETPHECSGTFCIFNVNPTYSILSSVFNFYLPMLAMCFIYFKIYQIARTQYLRPSPSPQLELKSAAANSPVQKPKKQQKNTSEKRASEETIKGNIEKGSGLSKIVLEKKEGQGNRREIEELREGHVAASNSPSDSACHETVSDERHDDKMSENHYGQEFTAKTSTNAKIDKETEEIKRKDNPSRLDDEEVKKDLSQSYESMIRVVEETSRQEDDANDNGMNLNEDRRSSQENEVIFDTKEFPKDLSQNDDVVDPTQEIRITTNKTPPNASAMTSGESPEKKSHQINESSNEDPAHNQNNDPSDTEDNESTASQNDDVSSPQNGIANKETGSPQHGDIMNITPLEMQNILLKKINQDDRIKSASQDSIESTCTLQSTITYCINRVNMSGSRETIGTSTLDVFSKRKKIFVKNKKAARTVSIIVGTFLLCWLPHTTLSIVKNICQHRCFSNQVLVLHVEQVSLLLGYLSAVINPIVYSYRNTQFRKSYQKMVRKLLPCLKTLVPRNG